LSGFKIASLGTATYQNGFVPSHDHFFSPAPKWVCLVIRTAPEGTPSFRECSKWLCFVIRFIFHAFHPNKRHSREGGNPQNGFVSSHVFFLAIFIFSVFDTRFRTYFTLSITVSIKGVGFRINIELVGKM